jgi:hypothetical protein
MKYASAIRRMKPEQLIGIGLFTVALVLTVYTWIDRIQEGREKRNIEGFSGDIIGKATLDMITKAVYVPPTDAEAEAAHAVLLRYIQHDFGKGIKFARDFGDRFFGTDLPFREDLDIRKLMDNYQSPLQRV